MRDNREYKSKLDFGPIVSVAIERASALQPWSDYYKLRAKEMESLFSIYSPASRSTALDIGSGLGFNALLLASIYGKSVATDLYTEDVSSHSLGMDRAKRFLDAVSARNVDAVSCRCESLPFKDGHFDSVYIIYTLEHIKDRVSALKEAGRVLKPGGEVVIVVPNFLERLLYPLSFYRDIIKKIFSYAAVKKAKNAGGESNGRISAESEGSALKRFGSGYPHFPFPEPHGEYSDYFVELAMSTSFEWARIVRKSGLKLKRTFTTMLFPKEFSSLVLGSKALDFYIKTIRINNRFGESAVLKHLGQNLCLIAEK